METFRRVFDHTPDALIVVDHSGLITKANPKAELLFGYRLDEIIGQPIEKLIPERLTHKHIDLRTAYFANPTMRPMGANLELVGRRKDNSEVPVEVLLSPMSTDDGRFVLCVVRDISERKQSEAMFRSLLESAPDAMVITNRQGNIARVNQETERLFGYSREELIGKEVEILIPQLHREKHRVDRNQYFEKPHRRPMGTSLALFGVRKNGTEFPVEVSLSPLELKDGLLVTAAIRDITERQKSEDEKRQLQNQIQHSQKLESLGILTGGIAHDFNNLLTAILGNASLASLHVLPESPAFPAVEEIEKASSRAAELIEQMLAYAGKGRFLILPINLSRIVDEMTHLLRTVVSKKATLRLEFADDLPMVSADATQLRQVIMNLITNASDALGEKSGVITIRTGVLYADQTYLQSTYIYENLPAGNYVYLEVSDTGCGMDQDTLHKIFDPFFTTKFHGRGLGLAAVLGIIRGHGGAIKIESELNRGTTFKILLPFTKFSEGQTINPPQTQTKWKGSGTILVIDDEESVRILSRRVLELAGFQVLLGNDGRDGLAKFKEHINEIRLVLLDLTMPHLNGEEVFREMRLLKPNVKVVLMSGYSEQEVDELFAGKGLTGFVQKPFRTNDLIKTIRQSLEEKNPIEPA